MSGIAGVVRFDGGPVSNGIVETMTDAMKYRGPDGQSHWTGPGAALGHCLMHTTPQSTRENQPLHCAETGLVIVFAGRLDNQSQLLDALDPDLGAGLNGSDSALTLAAIRQWGPDSVSRLGGDFSFVVFDPTKRLLIAARDKVGGKPFHYAWDGRHFAFASDPGPILSLPWLDQRVNKDAVAEAMACQWSDRTQTIWQGLLRLEPAHVLAADSDGVRIQRYWSPDLNKRIRYKTRREYIAHYADLFIECVRRSSASPSVLACEVSGGLDSSAVFAAAVALSDQDQLSAPALAAYTLDFDRKAGGAYEVAYAEKVASRFNHSLVRAEVVQKPLDWYHDYTRKYHALAPYPNGVMNCGVYNAARHDGARVVLTGLGGDEWLLASPNYYAEGFATLDMQAIRKSIAADVRAFGIPVTLSRMLRRGLFPLLPDGVKSALRTVVRRNGFRPAASVLCDEMANRLAAGPGVNAPSAQFPGQIPHIATLQNPFQVGGWEMQEHLAAVSGIDLRQPLYHPDIVEFAFATPAWVWHRGEADKALHRDAMIGLLPEVVRNRRSKAEFSTVFRSHLRELRTRTDWQNALTHAGWSTPDHIKALFHAVSDRTGPMPPEYLIWGHFTAAALAGLE